MPCLPIVDQLTLYRVNSGEPEGPSGRKQYIKVWFRVDQNGLLVNSVSVCRNKLYLHERVPWAT
eukprot:scaffold340925_cov30-Attheya_sp.AAC.2